MLIGLDCGRGEFPALCGGGANETALAYGCDGFPPLGGGAGGK